MAVSSSSRYERYNSDHYFIAASSLGGKEKVWGVISLEAAITLPLVLPPSVVGYVLLVPDWCQWALGEAVRQIWLFHGFYLGSRGNGGNGGGLSPQ